MGQLGMSQREKVFWGLLALSLVALAAWFYIVNFTYRFPAGQAVAPELPRQREITEKKTWNRDGYLITALAEFEMTGRVLIADRYWNDREADLSPIDLTLAWGPASDTAVLEKLSFYKLPRYYRYEWDDPSVDATLIKDHTANMHMIGARPMVERQLKRVRREQIVTLRGYLVQVDATDGWHWKSSLSRTDSGNGACEVVLVESLSTH